MVTAESVKAKMQGLIDRANEATGNADTDLTGAVGALIAGFGQGGGEAIGTADIPTSITGLLYALTSGNYVHGSFTLATPLPGTETLIFSTGLEKINGILITVDGFPYINAPDGQQTGMFLYIPELTEWNALIWLYYHRTVRAVFDRIEQGVPRIDGGDFYVTATYGGNYGFTPFAPGVTYTWVAW